MKEKVVAIIFAGGQGSRLNSSTPKQFLEVDGVPILVHTVLRFQKHTRVDAIILVVNDNYITEVKSYTQKYDLSKVAKIVAGGASSQESIYRGLREASLLFSPKSIVLIHDGVRPYITEAVIDKNIASVYKWGSAITSTQCTETIVVSRDGTFVDSVTVRAESYVAQAPQSFRLGDLLDAHEKIQMTVDKYNGLVDQASLYLRLGLQVHLVEGNRGNIKITTQEDIFLFKAMIEYQKYKALQEVMQNF